jgi:hypothetical protein
MFLILMSVINNENQSGCAYHISHELYKFRDLPALLHHKLNSISDHATRHLVSVIEQLCDSLSVGHVVAPSAPGRSRREYASELRHILMIVIVPPFPM